MKLPVVWLQYRDDAPARGYWDQGMLEDLFANKIQYLCEFEHKDSLEGLDGAIIVLPARNQVMHASRLHNEIQKLKWVLLILSGDEESDFPIEEIQHPNMRVWVMSPKFPRHKGMYALGSGYPPHFRALLPKTAPEKTLDWFFAGQVTHERRDACVDQLASMPHGELLKTPGFTQGMEHKRYVEGLASAKVSPAPSGPATPESFRLFEGLEAGCIPIGDPFTPKNNSTADYWIDFFGEAPPFPVINEWSELPDIMRDILRKGQTYANKVFAWWQTQKLGMARRLRSDLKEIGVEIVNDEQVTIVMPTSPAPLHPSTEDIEQTIRDVRVHLPNARMIITADGIRGEQKNRRVQYTEYLRRLLWLVNQMDNTEIVTFNTHEHQCGMMRAILNDIWTPYLLYVEHDAPLTPDNPIEWEGLYKAMEVADIIRLNHESHILDEHQHLMIDGPVKHGGVYLQKTVQWSQRPHLARTEYYKRIMFEHFNEDSKTMIEDKMHSVAQSEPWSRNRLWVYHPEGNIQRSYHLDSRGDDPKYSMVF